MYKPIKIKTVLSVFINVKYCFVIYVIYVSKPVKWGWFCYLCRERTIHNMEVPLNFPAFMYHTASFRVIKGFIPRIGIL